MKPRALLLHGGPGLNDYLGELAAELDDVFSLDRYEQGAHSDVPAFVAEARSQLRVPSWLVGHSWGGYLALQVAAADATGIDGLVLVGSLGALGDGGWAAASPRLTGRLTDEEREALEHAEDRMAVLWPAYFSSPEAATPYPGLQGKPGVLAAIYEWVQQHGDELAPRLAGFDKPVLILHGTHDHIPLEPVEETAALLHADLRVLDGLGHFPWLERPGIVREAVVDFLSSRSS